MKKDAKLLPDELMKYLQRVGAEVVSFRRAIIREKIPGSTYGSYDRVAITIGAEGTIKCQRKEFNPTKEEAENIASSFKGLVLPKSLNASKAESLSYVKKLSGDSFLMFDRKDGKVRMIHERIAEGEGKGYVPHTLWNDGEWRRMEPDGLLPFWKPEKKVPGVNYIMIHEGAKAARHVSTMNMEEHPWGKELSEYEHWGMIGGAINPSRSDWDEVRREKPKRVVYVCDNDVDGKSALQIVSKVYGGSLRGVMFDNNFGESWDMADEVPKGVHDLADYMMPATWATKAIYTGQKGRPSYELTRDFKKEWVHSVRPEVYVHENWPSNLYGANEFNNLIRPFSDVEATSSVVCSDQSMKAVKVDYIPYEPPGVFTRKRKGGRVINTYSPGEVEPVKGDPGPWIEYLEMMLPIESDRIELMKWCATLITHPEIRMGYGLLLVSETQGIGKTTLGSDILSPIIGVRNTSTPDEKAIIDSQFNDWMIFKRLVLVQDIYAGHSSKAYDSLKSKITDKHFMANDKYEKRYQLDNWAHFIATSNSMKALKLENTDRRWFVPKVTETLSTRKYWDEFRDWLDNKNGLGIIMNWAFDWVKKNGYVKASDHAPESTAKRDMIKENLSDGQNEVDDFLQMTLKEAEKESWMISNTKPAGANGSWTPSGFVIFDRDLVDLIQLAVHNGGKSQYLEKPLTVRKLAKATKRLFIHDEMAWVKGRIGRLIVSSRELLEIPMKEVLARVRPLDVKKLWEERRRV